MYFKKIYKKDSSGKIRELEISTMDGVLYQGSGVIGTKNQILHKKLCEGKNIGKSNETSPIQQSELEAGSLFKEKMRLGYFETIKEAEEKGGKDFLLPMLAKDYKKEAKKVKFPCYAQPKLDGMRGLGEAEGITSRTGKPVETVSHINLSFIGDEIIDGEIYEHGESFQGIMRKVKKYRQGETEKLKYHVYDLVSDLPFPQRLLKLHALVQGCDNIELVHTSRINSEEELFEIHKQNLAQGYEGTMVRHSEEGYQVNKRSSQLLKYKDFLDETYTVIDVVPFESRPEQGTVKCCLNTKKWFTLNSKGDLSKISEKEFDGAEFGFPPFKTGMKLSHNAREEMLLNKHNYIGKMAEVRFFEFSEDGIPRFPVCVGFREDK